MDQLIKVTPEIAEVVLDYCIQYSPHEKKKMQITLLRVTLSLLTSVQTIKWLIITFRQQLL